MTTKIRTFDETNDKIADTWGASFGPCPYLMVPMAALGHAMERLRLDDLALILALYSFRKEGSTRVWASKANIAQRACVSQKTVQRGLQRLEERGLVVLVGRAGGDRSTNEWDVRPLVDALDAALAELLAEQTTTPNADAAPTMTPARAAKLIELDGEVDDVQLDALMPSVCARLIEFDRELAMKMLLKSGLPLPHHTKCKETYDAVNREIARALLPYNPRPWTWDDEDLAEVSERIVRTTREERASKRAQSTVAEEAA